MSNPQASTRYVISLLLTLAIFAVGETEIFSSNMAFRYVKPLALAGTGSIGDNWTSLPFFSPYQTAGDFCRKTGLVMEDTATGTPGATITLVNPSTGAITSGTCGNPSADALTFVPGWGIKIRQPNVTGAKTQIVIVGAHDPNLRIFVDPQRAGDPNPGYWYSVPYNTSAVTYQDLCNQIGIKYGGPNAGGFVRIDPATGQLQIRGCGSLGATERLIPGEAIEVIVNNPKSFVPEVL
jgi:hypothetical protein